MAIQSNYKNTLTYRFIPGSLGTDTSLDNGAIMTEEFRLKTSRDKRLSELKADPRIQWVNVSGSSPERKPRLLQAGA